MLTLGIFGRRNVGKSSLINAITEQNLAIVSDIAGTTTDPVKKSIELLDIGKAVIIDTAGFDDDTELGKQRVEKTKQVLQIIDFAILVFSENTFENYEHEWVENFEKNDIPYIMVHNKSDLIPYRRGVLHTPLKNDQQHTPLRTDIIDISAADGTGIQNIFNTIKQTLRNKKTIHHSPFTIHPKFTIHPNDIVVLVTPIDPQAPHARLILPQVQTIRAILDQNAIAITCQTEQLQQTLNLLKTPPTLVITDSQAFAEVEKIVPKHCRLTSFSILLAKQKGDFEAYLKGTPHINHLKNGDRILILEACTHQHTCEDIGRVKLPTLLQKHTQKTLHFDFVSGLSPLPQNDYAMVFQCGGCMITPKQLRNRLKPFIDNGIPISNYGMALAFLTGIFDRVTAPIAKGVSVKSDE